MSALHRAVKQGRKFQNPVETSVGGIGMMPKVLKLYLANREERVPLQPLGPFRTDPRLYRRSPANGLRVTWMGHSSMLIEIDGFRVLVDPIWEQRASPTPWMGPKRFFEPPLPLDELPALDVVLISHDHYDHLGKRTIGKLTQLEPASQARWVTSLGVGKRLRGFGVPEGRITELDWTQSVTVSGDASELTITALPARHFSGRKFWDRFETLWSSFVLKGGRHNVYFGSDSGLWDGFSEIGRQYGPFDLTMLEVGAYNELWKSIHMGPDGAAQAFQAMGGSGLLMPIHWGLFDLAMHGWRQPIERITQLADSTGVKLWAPEPGAPTDVIAGEAHRSAWWRRPVPHPAVAELRTNESADF
jgi:L-ascorbate metabolism protein UlaG (beta-lactamase superfamily)